MYHKESTFSQGKKYVSVKSTELKELDQTFCKGCPNSASYTS